MKTPKRFMLALPLAAALMVPALAQDNTPQASPDQKAATTQSQDQAKTDSSIAEHKPLELQSKEGFWGKVNPFARKKYLRRQMAPVVGRVNELDELTAQNSKMIRDVDSRSSEGIRLASLKVSEADSHAVEAGNKANLAHETATRANTRLESIEKTVNTIDQYQAVSDLEVRFRPGQNVLSSKAKAALDEIATPLKEQKGYVVEIQGFSSGKGRAALENSQRMAESVVRYLVIEHEIPVYRIFMVGMGNTPAKTTDGSKPRRINGGRVEISLLRNGLSDLQAQAQGQNVNPQAAQPQEQPKK